MRTYCIAHTGPWGDLNGKEIKKEKRVDIRVHIADSLCSTAESNTAKTNSLVAKQLKSNKK